MIFESIVNHWTHLPEWHHGRRLWVFYLTFADQPDLHKLVRRYHDALSGIDQLDPVDARWLHLTIQGVAFTDQLDEEQVDAIEREARKVVGRRTLPTLTVEAAELDFDAACMQVLPTEDIVQLRADLRDCVTRTVGAGNLYALPEPQDGFNPHISIAYANATIPHTGEIYSRMERIGSPEIRFDVPHVSMIHLGREDRRWFWDHERQLHFSRS